MLIPGMPGQGKAVGQTKASLGQPKVCCLAPPSASAGERYRKNWGLGSEHSIGSREAVPKFRKGILEHKRFSSGAVGNWHSLIRGLFGSIQFVSFYHFLS